MVTYSSAQDPRTDLMNTNLKYTLLILLFVVLPLLVGAILYYIYTRRNRLRELQDAQANQETKPIMTSNPLSMASIESEDKTLSDPNLHKLETLDADPEQNQQTEPEPEFTDIDLDSVPMFTRVERMFA